MYLSENVFYLQSNNKQCEPELWRSRWAPVECKKKGNAYPSENLFYSRPNNRQGEPAGESKEKTYRCFVYCCHGVHVRHPRAYIKGWSAQANIADVQANPHKVNDTGRVRLTWQVPCPVCDGSTHDPTSHLLSVFLCATVLEYSHILSHYTPFVVYST